MEKEVIKFVSQSAGVEEDKIKHSDTIEGSFGLGGLDTISFYEDFFETFKITNSQDFNIELYCANEGIGNVALLIKAIFSKHARKKLKKYDVTIKHLIKVAELKKWIDFKP